MTPSSTSPVGEASGKFSDVGKAFSANIIVGAKVVGVDSVLDVVGVVVRLFPDDLSFFDFSADTSF